MKKKIKKLLAGLGIALGVIVLSFILRSSPLFDQFEKKLSNGLYHDRPLSGDVVIVGIDRVSTLDPSEGGLGPFTNWSREYFATIINNLRASGAHSIFFDLAFANRSQTVTLPELKNLYSSYTNIEDFGLALAAYLGEEHPSDKLLLDAISSDVFLLTSTRSLATLENDKLVADELYGTLDYFADKGQITLGTAFTDGNEEAIYTLPLGFEIQGIFEESIPLKLARDYLYRGEETAGLFSADGNSYEFDSSRSIPNHNGQFLVNYSGKSFTFPNISFVDIYSDQFDPSTVEGKIVLIGLSSSFLQDVFSTPIDPDVAMPGVEVWANGIQTILDGALLKYMSAGSFFALLLVLSFLSVTAFLYLPMLPASVFLVVEIVAYPFFARLMFNRGTIVDLIWPVFAIVVSYLAVLAYRNFTEFKEKREIKNAFSHYVSADLVKQIVANPKMLRLGGERREITVLFLDLENFTALSESLQPQQVVQIINVYFDAFANVIMEHGGTVDKFEGDAIMALFGAPVTSPNHAVNACTAAMSLRAKITELNKSTGQNLNMRIGIATGPTIVGNMGSKSRFDYTAMGDTVNTASRLEGGNKFYGTRILVNPGTCAAAQNWIAFRRLDKVRLKGKKEAIDIFEILGLVETLSEDGKKIINEWHQALEYYRNQEWAEAENRIKKVQGMLPNDGPSKTYLERIARFRENPPEGFDGIWNFESK